MSNYSPALTAHLGRDVTTLCHCWRLTRRDGQVSGFTDHDLPLIVDGTTFRPDSGFGASEARKSLGLGVDTVDIEGALSSAEIDADDVAAGLYDGATVETLLVNWKSPVDFARLRRSTVAKITRADGHFLAELQSPMRALDRPNGRHVTRGCDANLGDARCGVDLDAPALSGIGALVEVEAADVVHVSGLGGLAAGWFAGGRIEWTSGALAGRKETVRLHAVAGGIVRLTLAVEPPRAMPQAGDTLRVTAGCDKAFATCKAKFGNGANFRGFPHLPGNDDAYAYVTDDGVFDGGALVE